MLGTMEKNQGKKKKERMPDYVCYFKLIRKNKDVEEQAMQTPDGEVWRAFQA